MQNIHEEYERIFVGLGAGELVPYGSWYVEKQIQSTPLARIRTDLRRLGIVRQIESFESEDHVGVLCEIMALLSTSQNSISEQQAEFFNNHLATWMPQFFIDLQDLVNIRFYRQVAGFGRSFLQAESKYLQRNDFLQKSEKYHQPRRISGQALESPGNLCNTAWSPDIPNVKCWRI